MIGAIALGTFLFRFSFFALLANRTMPPWVTRTLRLVPPAVLTALIVPGVAFDATTGGSTTLAGRLVAVTVAKPVAWRTGNMFLTIVLGLAVVWAF